MKCEFFIPYTGNVEELIEDRGGRNEWLKKMEKS